MAVLRVDAIGAASLVSAAALVAALIGLHRLALRDLDQRGANLVLLFALAYPASLFFGVMYAEGLLLACLVWCFLAARSGHWWWAAVFAAAAVLTKVYLVILVVPLAIEYMETRAWSLRRVRADALLIVAGPAVAIAALMLYMQMRFGDPLRFLHAEMGWQHQISGPWTSVAGSIRDVTSAILFDNRFQAVTDMITVVLLLGASAYAFVRSRRSYAALILLSAVVFMSNGVLRSTTRYALSVFPLFILAAILLRHRPRIAVPLVIASCGLGAYLTYGFALNRFVG